MNEKTISFTEYTKSNLALIEHMVELLSTQKQDKEWRTNYHSYILNNMVSVEKWAAYYDDEVANDKAS